MSQHKPQACPYHYGVYKVKIHTNREDKALHENLPKTGIDVKFVGHSGMSFAYKMITLFA